MDKTISYIFLIWLHKFQDSLHIVPWQSVPALFILELKADQDILLVIGKLAVFQKCLS